MAFVPPIPDETPIDLSDIKVSVTSRSELNRYEAENVLKATTKYLASRPNATLAPFKFAWCLRVHYEMFGDVFKSAGQFRTGDLSIGSPFGLIAAHLAGLLDDLHAWSDHDIELLEQAAKLHHGAVKIHPFPNGNGRWARMLANIWLYRNDQSLTQWPEQSIGAVSVARTEYIAAIKLADIGDFEPLIALHRRYSETIG